MNALMRLLYFKKVLPLQKKNREGLGSFFVFLCPGNISWDISAIKRTDTESLQCVCILGMCIPYMYQTRGNIQASLGL